MLNYTGNKLKKCSFLPNFLLFLHQNLANCKYVKKQILRDFEGAAPKMQVKTHNTQLSKNCLVFPFKFNPFYFEFHCLFVSVCLFVTGFSALVHKSLLKL